MTAPSTNCDQQRSHLLNLITMLVRQRGRHQAGPAWHRATDFALVPFVVLAALVTVAWISRVPTFLTLDVRIAGTVVALTCGVIGYATAPFKTWDEAIFDRLTRYEPLNPVAYQELQDRVAVRGLDDEVLSEWLKAERASIGLPPRWEIETEASRKIRKRLSERRSAFLKRSL